jgi:hypothetical protein
LVAQGTAEDPIVFTSNASSPAPGDWKGIYFRNETYDSATILEYCVVEFGGYSHNSGIFCDYSSPIINFCTVRSNKGDGFHIRGNAPVLKNSKIIENTASGIFLEASTTARIGAIGEGNEISLNGSYGIYSNDAAPYPVIEDNEISQNGSYPIRVGACMRVYKNSILANQVQAIEVLGEEVTKDTIWYNNGLPLIIRSDINVRHPSATHYNSPSWVKLTIEPGVVVRFTTEAGLYIGQNSSSTYDYWGALVAQGHTTTGGHWLPREPRRIPLCSPPMHHRRHPGIGRGFIFATKPMTRPPAWNIV